MVPHKRKKKQNLKEYKEAFHCVGALSNEQMLHLEKALSFNVCRSEEESNFAPSQGHYTTFLFWRVKYHLWFKLI